MGDPVRALKGLIQALNGRQVTRARTERVLMTDLEEGEEGIFSYNLFFPMPDYNVIGSVGSTFGQLIATLTRDVQSDGRPVFSLDTDVGSNSRLYAMMAEANRAESKRSASKNITLGNLKNSNYLQNKWNKVDLKFKLSSTGEGYMNFFFNGKLKGSLRGATMFKGGRCEIRYGIYQTGTNQYSGGSGKLPPQVVYFADLNVYRVSGS